MNRFDDKGGRRTIGGREIAIEEWQNKVEAVKDESVLLTVCPEEMGDMARHSPTGNIWIPKSQETEFFEHQRKKETNGQTLARLLRDGTWKVGKLSSKRK